MKVMHGYFSMQARRHGSVVWRRKDGSDVEVTMVADSKDWADKHYLWVDKIYVGELTQFVRSGIEQYDPWC